MRASDFVRKKRKATGFTQAEFASLFGVGSTAVSGWETGSLLPTEHQRALMKAFPEACDARAAMYRRKPVLALAAMYRRKPVLALAALLSVELKRWFEECQAPASRKRTK